MLKLISSIIIVTVSFSVNATTYTPPPMKTCVGCSPIALSVEQAKQCIITSDRLKTLQRQISQKEKTLNLYSETEVNAINKLMTNFNNLNINYEAQCANKSYSNVNKALQELNK